MAEEFNTQLASVTGKFLKETKVPFTKTGIKTNLMNHPFYPSLLSLSDTLNQYKIHNRALKIEINQLEELPTPFFAFIYNEEINSKDFVCVSSVSENSVTYFYNGTNLVTKNDFIKSWNSQIVLLAEPNSQSKEDNYLENLNLEKRKKTRNIFLTLGFVMLFGFGLQNFFNTINSIIPPSIYFVLTLLGLSISILLLIFEIDKSNKLIKNICTTGIKTNCDAILSSSASKIFGISWAEIGFYYFTTLCLYLMIPASSFIDKTHIISILSLLTALYIPFSLSYQYFVIKQWCKLCLFVQLTLLLQFLWVMLYGRFSFDVKISEIVVLGACALIPIVSWNF
ncbi:vitamin K epoxide reductase family protein, partial [Chryseobacterium sp.]|uniref:vitamin K epoxide reductase family protein n=1 Tax=Chryseobacterium sp. TaxID=1871047 RepID=UPI003218F085